MGQMVPVVVPVPESAICLMSYVPEAGIVPLPFVASVIVPVGVLNVLVSIAAC